MFTNIRFCIDLLNSKDKRKFIFVMMSQVSLGFLDLAGVALIGVLGAITVNGVKSIEPGDRAGKVLGIFNLENLDIHNQTIVLGAIAITFLVSKTFISLLLSRKTLHFLSYRSSQLSSILISKLMAQQLPVVNSKTSQEVIYAATTGVSAITFGVLGNFSALVADVTLILILGTALLVFSPIIAISTIGLFCIVLFLLHSYLNKKSQELSRSQTELSIQYSNMMMGLLNSYRELFARNRRLYVVEEISANRELAATAYAEQTWLPNIGRNLIEIALTCGGLILAGIQFSSHDASNAVGGLAIFMAAATRMAPALLRIQQNLVSMNSQIVVAAPGLDLFMKLKSQPILKATTDKITSHKSFTANVVLEDVTYSYPNSNQSTISNARFRISEGSQVAFVGPSGAGKSTLVDLVLGILKPTHGSVTVSGVDPEKAIELWPGKIAYIPQTIELIDGSVRQNLSLGFQENSFSDADYLRVLKKVHLVDFFFNKDLGLDYHISERGSNLSGGQRQRLGIARALLTNPEFLILDEATSSLDASSELLISEMLAELRGTVTILLIAHRLSTVRLSDSIIYLAEGKILATGTFEEVRAKIPDFDRQAKLMGL